MLKKIKSSWSGSFMNHLAAIASIMGHEIKKNVTMEPRATLKVQRGVVTRVQSSANAQFNGKVLKSDTAKGT
jgi:hypothetical protein